MAKAADYPNIRLFTVQRVSSATELEEPPEILQQWSVASTGKSKLNYCVNIYCIYVLFSHSNC